MLNPSAVILADESLPVAVSRDGKNIELSFGSRRRRDAFSGRFSRSKPFRKDRRSFANLARKLARSLGILEREPIRAQIKALAQNDRAELRKLGVRFGAYYIFVPALIKPAPRTLALQLWGLQAPGDANELLRTLGPVASSGRTSLPLDKGISKEGYRVAGYRPCGERIVRVDVVERLAGMIRAAIGGEPLATAPGRPSHRTLERICRQRGDDIVDRVLRRDNSLRFCVLWDSGRCEMRRSDFFGSPSADESRGQGDVDRPGGRTRSDGARSRTAARRLRRGGYGPHGFGFARSTLADGVPVDMASSRVSADRSGAPSSVHDAESCLSADIRFKLPNRQKKADMIAVWRPGPSQDFTQSRERSANNQQGETPGRLGYGRPWLGSDTQNGARGGYAPAQRSQIGLTAAHADEKRRQRTSDRDMPRSNPTTGAAA